MAKINQRGAEFGLKINHKLKDFNNDRELYLKAIYDDNADTYNVSLDQIMSFQQFVSTMDEKQVYMEQKTGKRVYLPAVVEAVGLDIHALTEEGKHDRMGHSIYKTLIDHKMYGELREFIGRNVAFDTDLLEWAGVNRTFIYDGKYVIYLGNNGYENAYIKLLEDAQEDIEARRAEEEEQRRQREAMKKANAKAKKKPEKVYNF